MCLLHFINFLLFWVSSASYIVPTPLPSKAGSIFLEESHGMADEKKRFYVYFLPFSSFQPNLFALMLNIMFSYFFTFCFGFSFSIRV